MRMMLRPQGKVLRPRRPLISMLSVCLAITAGGCNNTQIGAIGGGIVGSGACLLARGSALACAALGVAGAVAGGVIGHAFDERDRARHDAAVRQALLNQSLWQTRSETQLATAEPTADKTEAELEQPAVPAPALELSAPAPRARRTVASHAVAPTQPVTWQNPDTSNSGEIVPLRTFASPATGQTCKVYAEKYIRDGKEYSDTKQACPKSDGSFDIKVLS